MHHVHQLNDSLCVLLHGYLHHLFHHCLQNSHCHHDHVLYDDHSRVPCRRLSHRSMLGIGFNFPIWLSSFSFFSSFAQYNNLLHHMVLLELIQSLVGHGSCRLALTWNGSSLTSSLDCRLLLLQKADMAKLIDIDCFLLHSRVRYFVFACLDASLHKFCHRILSFMGTHHRRADSCQTSCWSIDQSPLG